MNRLSVPGAAFLRYLARRLSPAGERARLITLIFHRVVAEHDPMNADEPDAKEFGARMDLLRELFHVMTLREAAERMAKGDLPARAACVTFDDGYENNWSVAAQVLAAREMPATFFIATGFIGNGIMWNDVVVESIRRCSVFLDLSAVGLGQHELPDVASRARLAGELLPKLKYRPPAERQRLADTIASIAGGGSTPRLMMSEGQLRKLAGLGMEIGAHTVSHPILANVDDAAARAEIRESKHRLEEITGSVVSSFAYPNGRPQRDYRGKHVGMVRDAGFKVAVSTAWGCAGAAHDRYQLPRVSPWDRGARRYAVRLIRTYLQASAATA